MGGASPDSIGDLVRRGRERDFSLLSSEKRSHEEAKRKRPYARPKRATIGN